MTFTETLQKEYVRNPFLVWTLVVIGLTTFDSWYIASTTLDTIVKNELFIPILVILLIITYRISIYPLQEDIVKFGKKDGNKRTAIIMIALMYSIFYVNAIYYLVEPFTIFAIYPGFITEKQTFDNSIDAAHLIVFLALPLLSAFTFTHIKYVLNKKK